MGLENKRDQIRIRVSLPVEVCDVVNKKSFTCKIIDISAKGAAIAGAEELSTNTKVLLTFTLEGAVYKEISANIVREVKRGDQKYVGSAFFNLDEQARSQLEESIRRVHSRILRGCRQGIL